MRARNKVLLYIFAGGAFGALASLLPGALVKGASDILGIEDFLRIGAAGVFLALPGAMLERSPRKVIPMALSGFFTSQLLVLLVIFTAKRFTSASAILGACLAAAGAFPAVLALIDRLAGGNEEEIPHAMLMAAVGGILGLALGWLLVREDLSPALVMGSAYGAGVWTAMGLTRSLSSCESEPLPETSEEPGRET